MYIPTRYDKHTLPLTPTSVVERIYAEYYNTIDAKVKGGVYVCDDT